ncbi:MAG: amidohydrolase, partial [Actinobacteria bacterium]
MTTRTASVLYRGGRVFCPGFPTATALLVREGRVTWLGLDVDAPRADAVVELAGALVTPAFVDAHVHVTDTGLALSGVDLSGARRAADVLDAAAAAAAGAPAPAVGFGPGWDGAPWADPALPAAHQLWRAGGGRPGYPRTASDSRGP